jgi:hypothetical protein
MSTYFYSPIHHPSIFTSLIYLQRCHLPDPSGKTHVFQWGFLHNYSHTAQFVRLELFLPLHPQSWSLCIPIHYRSSLLFIISLNSHSLSLWIPIHYLSTFSFIIPLQPLIIHLHSYSLSLCVPIRNSSEFKFTDLPLHSHSLSLCISIHHSSVQCIPVHCAFASPFIITLQSTPSRNMYLLAPLIFIYFFIS